MTQPISDDATVEFVIPANSLAPTELIDITPMESEEPQHIEGLPEVDTWERRTFGVEVIPPDVNDVTCAQGAFWERDPEVPGYWRTWPNQRMPERALITVFGPVKEGKVEE